MNESTPSHPIFAKHPEAAQMIENLRSESDRGVLLITAAYAEQLLAELLGAALAGDGVDELFETSNAPLSGIRNKIMMARALGVLPRYIADGVDQLRKARNHCAHHVHEVTFADQRIKAHINNIVIPDGHDIDTGDRYFYIGRIVGLMAVLQGWTAFAIALLGKSTMRADMKTHAELRREKWGLQSDPRFRFE